MKISHYLTQLSVGLLVVGLLVACRPATPTTGSETAAAVPPAPTTGAKATTVPSPTPAGNEAAQKAAQALAQTLGIDVTAVSIASIEAHSWPDSCLGIQTPGVLCAQHVVDGYQVTLAAAGQQFPYRTNGDGSSLAADVALTWTREGGIAGFCNELIIDVTGTATAYSCEGMPYTQVGQQLLIAEPRQQLYDWINSRQSFDFNQSNDDVADGMTITMVFNGQGDSVASASDQSDIQAFAAQIYTQLALEQPTSTPSAACALAANNDVPLYFRPDTSSGQFGVLSSGQQAVITGQAPGGWLGFDPGVAQAANVGIFRLRWLAPGSDVAPSGGCDGLMQYPLISPTACYEMAMADTPIYAQPDDTAAVITTLPAGGYTAVTGKTAQNWYQVNLGDGSLADNHSGQTGWIASADANFNGQSCTNLPIVTP